MNRITDYKQLQDNIVAWIRDYAISNNIKSLVVGVSGGIDSAVTSALCCQTGLPTYCAVIDIYSNKEHTSSAIGHCQWLDEHYPLNSSWRHTNMDKTMETIIIPVPASGHPTIEHLAANTKSRLRMLTLYNHAGASQGIVVGTGNKIEDFGIGFYTKYGDGGVDISPIADLYKTEVRELGKYMGISQEILDASPTDGLWSDGRTDEQQIGATYEELEWAMDYDDFCLTLGQQLHSESKIPFTDLSDRQQEVIKIYRNLNRKNQHKMQPIPIYRLPL